MENKKTILVPWDFSQIAEFAFEHAVKFGTIIGCDITLVHVVKKAKDIVEATNKINESAEELFVKYKAKPNVVIREGNIFTTITEVATDLEAELVIMGTHGMKGMQKFTGSWALKVIVGTRCPFVVVQEPPKGEMIEKVVFPIDFRVETKEKLSWAYYLAKYYRARIQICKPNLTDERIIRKTNSNIVFAKKYLEERNIDYEITTVEGTDDFAEATISFAKKIEADLILILTTKNITFQDYVLGAEEQKIIANKLRIPVMCVNPRPDLRKLGGFGN